MSNEERYVIWNEERGMWWGKARWGYTKELTKAGHYTRAEAEAIVADSRKYPTDPLLPFNDVAFQIGPLAEEIGNANRTREIR